MNFVFCSANWCVYIVGKSRFIMLCFYFFVCILMESIEGSMNFELDRCEPTILLNTPHSTITWIYGFLEMFRACSENRKSYRRNIYIHFISYMEWIASNIREQWKSFNGIKSCNIPKKSTNRRIMICEHMGFYFRDRNNVVYAHFYLLYVCYII